MTKHYPHRFSFVSANSKLLAVFAVCLFGFGFFSGNECVAAREAARRMQCTNHVIQIVLAFHSYADEHNGGLPPLYTVDADGKPLHSWRVLILPYMEQKELYDKIRLNEPWDSEYNQQFHNTKIDYYHCPSCPHKGKGKCNYSAIAGEEFAVFVPAKKAGEMTAGKGLKIPDGRSNTWAIVEVKKPFCWMDPTADITLAELTKGVSADSRLGSHHTNVFVVGVCDGSVRGIPHTVDTPTLEAWATTDDSQYQEAKKIAEKKVREMVEEVKKSAEQGDAEKQCILGLLYAVGIGVRKDEKQAVEWFKKSAAQGDAKAQYYLGVRYEYGKGVPQDELIAKKWYKRAAEQKNESAIDALDRIEHRKVKAEKEFQDEIRWHELMQERIKTVKDAAGAVITIRAIFL
jgi:hypothetical protein